MLKNVDWFPTALSSSASAGPEIVTAKSSRLDLTGLEKPEDRDSNENAAASSQVRQRDVEVSHDL